MLTVQERKRRVLCMFAFLLRDLLVITALVGLVAWMQERDRPSPARSNTAVSARVMNRPSARTYLIGLRLDFINNYLAIEKFAEHNGLLVDEGWSC